MLFAVSCIFAVVMMAFGPWLDPIGSDIKSKWLQIITTIIWGLGWAVTTCLVFVMATLWAISVGSLLLHIPLSTQFYIFEVIVTVVTISSVVYGLWAMYRVDTHRP